MVTKLGRWRRYGTYFELVLVCVALILPGAFAAGHLARWPVRLRYPGELDNGEGAALAEMAQLREGVAIYAPATAGRFSAANYGPLFYLLGSRLVDPRQPAYFRLRVLGTLAVLGLAAGCGLLAFWLSGGYLAAAVASLMFLAYALVTAFGVIAHCDTVALLLWFSSFLIAYRFQSGRGLLLAIPLMAVAFCYKQQFVVAPLAVVLFLLLQRRFRLAAEFAGLLALAALALLAVMQFLVFPHQALLLHLLSYNVIPFSWRLGLRWLLLLTLIFLLPCLAATHFLRLYPDKLLACYFGCAVVLLPAAMARRGADMNYCFELLLGLCPLCAALLAVRIAEPSRAVPLLYLLAITVLMGQVPRQLGLDPQPDDFAQDRAVQEFLRQRLRPGTPALGYFAGDLLRAGLDTPITNLYHYSWLVCKGTLSGRDLLAQVGDRRFGVILLPNDLRSEGAAHDPMKICLTEPLHRAIIQNYRLAASFGFHIWQKRHYYAWVPRR